MIKNENYITIQGWMINELQLKGNDLMVYAIIYGFSQNEEDWYEGSQQYLADWCNSTTRTIRNILQNLINKGFIVKEDVIINNVKFCKYRASNFLTTEKISAGDRKNFPRGAEKISYNNIDNNITNKKENIIKEKVYDYDKLINDNISNEELKETIYDFIKMRRTIKSPLTTEALQQLIKRLNRLANNIDEQIEMLNKAILNNWKTVYPLTEEDKKFLSKQPKEKKKTKCYNYMELSQEDYARLMRKEVTAEQLEQEGKLTPEYI